MCKPEREAALCTSTPSGQNATQSQSHSPQPISLMLSQAETHWVPFLVFGRGSNSQLSNLRADINHKATELEAHEKTLPLLSGSKGCWGRRTQVSTFSPDSGSMSFWKVSRGCDWFSDSHRALSRSAVRDMGRWSSLERDDMI